jgi:hypothetical protein
VSSSSIPERVRVAARYIELGWPVFVLGEGKVPIGNCPRCNTRKPETYVLHDRETCTCLTCHGFYAATLDVQRFEQMLYARPNGLTAARTGGPSRLLVVDAEASVATVDGDDITGLDVLDSWETWVDGGWSLPLTLRQRTAGGGMHLVYRLPSGLPVAGHNRILPQVDIKADFGYILVADGMEPKRHWMDPIESLVDAPQELLDWINKKRGGNGAARWGGGRGLGGLLADEPYKLALQDGARLGEREPFFARLSFELRKAGTDEHIVVQEMRDHWEQCEQTPEDYFHWSYVEYKIERDRGIRPDRQVSSSLKQWATQASLGEEGGQVDESSGKTYRKVGRVTLVTKVTK